MSDDDLSAQSQPHAGSEAARLVVAYAFAPYADTSSIVAAKRVSERDEPVDVVQNAMDDLRGRDDTLDRLVGPLIRRRAVIDSPSRFGGWDAISAFSDHGLRVINGWLAEGRNYRSMYSRAHFVASHFLAARVKLRRPDVIWEAEFSDPVARTAVGEPRTQPVKPNALSEEMHEALAAVTHEAPSGYLFELAEQVTLALADRLLFTNEAQRDDVLSRCGDPALAEIASARSLVSAHPSPPPWAYRAVACDYELEDGRRHIGYFGNFYSSQQPATLLQAVAGLQSRDRERVRLHVFTGDEDSLLTRVREHEVDDVVRVRPRLPYLEFLALSRRMDVLLAVDAATPRGSSRNPVLLSKWSDYRGAGTPVWGVVEDGTALAAQDLAWRSPLGHVTAAMQVLTTIARS